MVAPLWLRFAWRRLVGEKLRTLLVLSSIALTTALSLSVLYASEVNVQSFATVVGFDTPTFPVVIRGESELPYSETGALLLALSDFGEVVAQTSADTRTRNGQPVQLVGITHLGSKSAEKDVSQFANKAVATSATLNALNLRAGEKTVFFGAAGASIEVVVESLLDQSEIVVPFGTVIVPARFLAQASPRGWSTILFKPQLEVDTARAVQALASVVTPELPRLRVETRSSRISRGSELLGAFRLNLLIMLGLTLIVGIILIFNASQLSLMKVKNELITLRTLGVSRLYCAGLVTGETLVVSFIGTFLGLTAGRPLTAFVISKIVGSARRVYQVPESFTGLALPKVLFVYGSTVGLSLVVGLLGGLHFSWRASRLEPKSSAERPSSSDGPLSRLPLFTYAAFSAASTAAGFVWLQLAPTLIIAYLSSLSLVIATFCIHVACTGMAGEKLSGLSRSNLPVSLQLGMRSLRLESGRHRIAVAAFALSLSLVTALGILVHSFRGTLESWITSRLSAPYYIGASNLQRDFSQFAIPDSVVASVERVPGVTEIARYLQTEVPIGGQRIVIGGADREINRRHGAYQIKELCGAAAEQGEGVYVSESAIRSNLVSGCSDTIQIEGKAFAVSAIIAEFSSQLPLVLLELRDFAALFPTVGTRSLAVYTSDERHSVEIGAALRGIVKDLPSLELIEQGTLRTYILSVFDETFLITKSVRIVLATLAMATLVMAIWQSIWERRHEMQLRKVLGVSSFQLRAAILCEALVAVCIAIPGGLLGGVLLSILMISFINPLSFGWSLTYSWSATDVFVPVLVLGILVAMLLWVLSGWTFKELFAEVNE